MWQNEQLRVAADLARDAQRAALRLRDIDALDLGALVEAMGGRHAQKPFPGAIGGNLFGGDLGARKGKALGELFEQRTRDVAHGAEVARAAVIDPVPELGRAHIEVALRHARLRERALKLGARGAGKRCGRARLGFEG